MKRSPKMTSHDVLAATKALVVWFQSQDIPASASVAIMATAIAAIIGNESSKDRQQAQKAISKLMSVVADRMSEE